MKPLNCILIALSCVAFSAPALAATASEHSTRSSIAEFSRYRSLDLARFERAFEISLKHEVPGVVESSLRDVVLIKIAQPGASCERIMRQVERLSLEGLTPAIRYKASLARQVLLNPGMFVVPDYDRFTTDGDVFTYISRQLEVAHLVHDG
jgi:hypothetical protein